MVWILFVQWVSQYFFSIENRNFFEVFRLIGSFIDFISFCRHFLPGIFVVFGFWASCAIAFDFTFIKCLEKLVWYFTCFLNDKSHTVINYSFTNLDFSFKINVVQQFQHLFPLTCLDKLKNTKSSTKNVFLLDFKIWKDHIPFFSLIETDNSFGGENPYESKRYSFL